MSSNPGKMLAAPAFCGTKMVPLFNGLLYRVEDGDTMEWAFFNNSKDYEFRVKYLFGHASELEALGGTTMHREDDGILCELRVLPLETRMFVRGKKVGYESKLEAMPLSEEYFSVHPELDEVAYFARVDVHRSSEF